MNIEDIKDKMLSYQDIFGGDIIYVEEIKAAKSKKELANIIEKYRDHLEDMISDAKHHLDRFKDEIGLKDI